jgi:predicted nucleic acid-binding protein
MIRIMIDTTVWIDFFRSEKTTQVDLLKECIENRFDICICSMIKMEILQGINDDGQYKKVRKNLDNLLSLPTLNSSYDLQIV